LKNTMFMKPVFHFQILGNIWPYEREWSQMSYVLGFCSDDFCFTTSTLVKTDVGDSVDNRWKTVSSTYIVSCYLHRTTLGGEPSNPFTRQRTSKNVQ
jgi:hypothetical protein